METVQKTGTIIVILALLTLIGLFIVRCAWLSDDAFITFRTVDNFVHGYGLTWNTDERVQTYTHPLWMFLVSLIYSFTREIYYTAIILSCVVSLLAVALYASGIAERWHKALVGVVVLCFSKVFMDYTTSGLENPLTFLLFAGFFVIYYRLKMKPLTLFYLSLCASFCVVNRLDTVIFFVPVLVYEYVSLKKWLKGAIAVVAGFLPLLCWTGFSFFYYGFPFPNTLYAKMNTGIDQMAFINQGLAYYLDAIKNDPIALPVILMGVFSYFFTKDKRTIPASFGILFYMAYILIIGGGFMSGRFFAVPFFCSVLILSYAPVQSYKVVWAPALCMVLFLSLRSPLCPVISDETYKNEIIPENGIADERGFYYQETGLLPALKKENEIPNHLWITKGRELKETGPHVVVEGYVGMMGFFAGPDVHFIDYHGITEPLLARIHMSDVKKWRTGHFQRKLPPGYAKTIETGENVIKNKHLALFYNTLSLVAKEDVFSPGRFKEIWNLNSGKYTHLLSQFKNEKVKVGFKDVSKPKDPGVPWDSQGTYLFPEKGVWINLGRKWRADQLELSLAYNHAYQLTYYKAWIKLKNQTIYPRPGNPGKLSLVYVDIPLEITKRGFTDLHITPVKGNSRYSIGHLTLKQNTE